MTVEVTPKYQENPLHQRKIKSQKAFEISRLNVTGKQAK